MIRTVVASIAILAALMIPVPAQADAGQGVGHRAPNPPAVSHSTPQWEKHFVEQVQKFWRSLGGN